MVLRTNQAEEHGLLFISKLKPELVPAEHVTAPQGPAVVPKAAPFACLFSWGGCLLLF